MDGTVLQIVHIRAVPLSVLVDVLHQQPSAVTGVIVQRTRLALMDDDELFCRTVDFQLDGAADGLGAQKHICHFVFPP